MELFKLVALLLNCFLSLLLLQLVQPLRTAPHDTSDNTADNRINKRRFEENENRPYQKEYYKGQKEYSKEPNVFCHFFITSFSLLVFISSRPLLALILHPYPTFLFCISSPPFFTYLLSPNRSTPE